MVSRMIAALLIVLVMTAPGNTAGGAGQASIDSLSLVRQLTQEAGQYYTQQMNLLVNERKTLSAVRNKSGEIPAENIERISEINRQLQDLSERKQKVEGSDQAWRAFESVRLMYQTLNQVEASLNQADTRTGDGQWLDKATGGMLAGYRDDLQSANTAVDYARRLKRLESLVANMQQQAPTPAFKTMRDGLNGLFWLMNTFGDKTGIPVVGDFLQKYGEAGTAMVAASQRIFQTIRDREGNQLLPGRHGDDGRYNAFERQFPLLADRMDIIKPQIPGLPDAYESGDGGVLIWDREHKKWYRTNPVHPENASLPPILGLGPHAAVLTPQQVLQRYIFLKQHGDSDPSPLTVLTDPARVVAIGLKPDREVTAPGGPIRLVVNAVTMAGDRKPVLLVRLNAKPKSSLSEALISSRHGVVRPSLVDLSEPEPVTWTAPDVSDTVFEISAALSDANDDSGLVQVGRAVAEVATGNPSQLRIRVEPAVCEPQADGQVLFSLTDSQGNALAPADGKQADELIILHSPDGLMVERPRWTDRESGKGWAPWHAPAAPGIYRLRVSFRGFSEFGVLSSRGFLGAAQTATVTVAGVSHDMDNAADQETLLSRCSLSISRFSAAPAPAPAGKPAVDVQASLEYQLSVPVSGRAVVSVTMDGIEQVRKTRDLEPGSRFFRDEMTLNIPTGKAAGDHQVAVVIGLELDWNGTLLSGPSDSRQTAFSLDRPDETGSESLAGRWDGQGIADATWHEEKIATHEKFKLTLDLADESSGTITFVRTVGTVRKLDPKADPNPFLEAGPVGETWRFPVRVSRSGSGVTLTEILEEDDDPEDATIIKLHLDSPDKMSNTEKDHSEYSDHRSSMTFQRQ
jgi:hypothetical protein